MPYHQGAAQEMKKIMEANKKKKLKSNSQIFEMKSDKISDANMKKLKEHSKMHKGGMQSTHIKNMKKFMKEGDSFSKAHNKAIKLDKKK